MSNWDICFAKLTPHRYVDARSLNVDNRNFLKISHHSPMSKEKKLSAFFVNHQSTKYGLRYTVTTQ